MKLEKQVELAKQGDKRAFEHIVREYQDDLYRLVRSKISNEEDCIDIVQESILAAYESIEKLKDNSKFKSWLFSILINKCKTYYSNKKQDLPLEDENIINSTYVMREDNSESILNYLEADEKQIIIMFYLEGYTSKEIAQIMEMNQNTVKTKIIRARQKLREKLKEEENDG